MALSQAFCRLAYPSLLKEGVPRAGGQEGEGGHLLEGVGGQEVVLQAGEEEGDHRVGEEVVDHLEKVEEGVVLPFPGEGEGVVEIQLHPGVVVVVEVHLQALGEVAEALHQVVGEGEEELHQEEVGEEEGQGVVEEGELQNLASEEVEGVGYAPP